MPALESQTLSKAEQLRGFVELKNNVFFQMFLEAAEKQASDAHSNVFTEQVMANIGAILLREQDIAVARVLGNLRKDLDRAIAMLTAEVKREQDDQKESTNETNIPV
jgi:hypothetical protein